MAFSNSGGGTLTLSSPTAVHQVDVVSSVRSLRRSLSRSPSKFRLSRADSRRSYNSDSSGCSLQSPSPASPCPAPNTTEAVAAAQKDSSGTPALTGTSLLQPSTSVFSTPLRSSVKLSLRSTRPKTTSSKPTLRPRPSPKSPLKRALSINVDMGNAAATPSPPSGLTTTVSEPLLPGQENVSNSSKFNTFLQSLGPIPRSIGDKPSRHSMHLDLSGDARSDALAAAVASPLKRSDAIMDFDQANLGSPVAKRRSLHGITSLGTNSNIFDFATPPSTTPAPRTPFEIHDDSSREYQLANSASVAITASPSTTQDSPAPATPSAMPKRTTSLRKSTLQQRHDPRSSWGRRQGEKYLAQQQKLMQAQPSKDSSNEWLFTAPHVRNNPRASLDQLLKPEPRESPFKVKGPLPNPSQHALDRPAGPVAQYQRHPLSRTLTTSSSGSSLPDDSPTHFPVQPPPERRRPTSIFARSLPLNAHRPKPEPVATPQYKSARPLQSVFASAGLVSKMNRNAEDDSQRPGGRAMVMPDTPCKKQVYPSNTYPPSSGSGRRKQQRRFFFSAAPETPFNTGPAQSRGDSATNANENVVNFFKLRSSHTRRSSLLSMDGDVGDCQGVMDGFDLPPTPTKSVLAKNLFGSGNKTQVSPIAIRDFKAVSTTPGGPPPVHFDSRRATMPLSSPCGSIGSDKVSPKTPRENSIFHSMEFAGSMAPPEGGRFPSSKPKEILPSLSTSSRPRNAIFPPATPTADREAFANFLDRRVSITPIHGAAPSDADAVLSSMFGKVERVGQGEFSQVFRVTTRQASGSAALDYFSATPSKHAMSSTDTSPSTQQVFAVKKVRMPLFGQKERVAKMREVAVLEAIRSQENVLQIFDHWERNGHLYIQTEFCEEGGMDSFLKKVGEHGRLDDFRIWKILLEMSQGLRYVHDAGFIHLDLKPANIFVTYEGHLKIGDFGLATEWPAPKDIEGEGDREYIGPEILQGKYDKPADIFSLGLIVLEIACNVFLPDNGPIWVALREGDMSVVPSLTAGEANALVRDPTGMPVVADMDSLSQDDFNRTDSLDLASSADSALSAFSFGRSRYGRNGALGGSMAPKAIGAEHPPEFMANQQLAGSLDSVVAWLINPDPASRPTVHQILEIDSLQWVYARRRAPATIFEGNWGPDGETSAPVAESDTEMTDV